MYSISYFFIAIVDLALLIWALNICKKFPTPAVILSTVPLSLLWFDNITVSLGSTLGDGQPLLALNFVRFMGHYVLLPATIIAIGSMARLANFKIAQSKWFIGAFCVVATYFSIHDLYLFSQASFYPSCFADTFRYTTHISDFTACSADADIGAGFKIMPWPAMDAQHYDPYTRRFSMVAKRLEVAVYRRCRSTAFIPLFPMRAPAASLAMSANPLLPVPLCLLRPGSAAGDPTKVSR